jgi:hypothetical protein
MTKIARRPSLAARKCNLRTAMAYRIGPTIEALWGRVVELEVVLRDLALSGEASNEDLGAELVGLARQTVVTALCLERACQRIVGVPLRPVRRRSPA